MAHQEQWGRKAPDSYVFTLTYSSMIGGRSERITVRDGRVVSAAPVDGARDFLPGTDRAVTVEGVFALAIKDSGRADKVTVTCDDHWGFPESVSVDSVAEAVDDEYGYGIAQFVVLSGEPVTPALELISAAATCRDPLVRGAPPRRVLFLRLGGVGQAHLRVVDAAGRDLIDPLTVSHGYLEPSLRPAAGTRTLPATGRVVLTAGSRVLVDEQHRLTPTGGRC